MLRRLWAALSALVLTAGVIVLPLAVAPTPAAAHAQLLTAAPATGEVLAASPDQISLTFNENLLDLGTLVLVVDADSQDHAAGTVVIDGDTVTAPVDDLTDGHYQVRWRVISADGHPISGVVPFTVGDVPADAPTPPAAAPVPTDDGSGVVGAVASGDVEASSEPADEAAAGWPRLLLIGGAGAAVALALLGLGVAVGRRTPGSHPSHDSRKQDTP